MKNSTLPVSAAKMKTILMNQLRSTLPTAPSTRSVKVVVPGSAPRIGLSPRKVATAL